MIHTLTHTLTDPAYVLSTILVCALCTQITRWLPFLLFGGKKKSPVWSAIWEPYFRLPSWLCWWYTA